MALFKEPQPKHHSIRFLIGAALAILLAAALLVAATVFKIRDIEVTGNSFYSAQEIIDKVVADSYSSNSL